jgi:hypothetical protein
MELGEPLSNSPADEGFVPLREIRQAMGDPAWRLVMLANPQDSVTIYIPHRTDARLTQLQQINELLDTMNAEFNASLQEANVASTPSDALNALCHSLEQYPQTLHQAAQQLQPQLLITYLEELARQAQVYFALISKAGDSSTPLLAARQVLHNALELAGIEFQQV